MEFQLTLDDPVEPISDIFFEMEVMLDNLPIPSLLERRKGVSDFTSLVPVDDTTNLIKVVKQNTQWCSEFACAEDRSHETSRNLVSATYGKFFGEQLSESFVPDVSDGGNIVANAKFAVDLKGTDLTGYQIVSVNWFDSDLDQKIVALDPVGDSCFRPLSINNAPNRCPWCKSAPIICPGCSQVFIFCHKCSMQTYTWEEDHQKHDIQLPKVSPCSKRPIPYLDGHRWDGADFICRVPMTPSMIVTRRALDWFLSVHAGPLFARSIAVDVSRMNRQQLDKLKSVEKL